MNQASPTTQVSVLGTGAIGASVVHVLLDAGLTVTVWNRTMAKTQPLVARGAVPATTPREAAAASPLVFLPLVDYGAVVEAMDAMADEVAGRTVITLTTGSPEDARTAARRAEAAGASYLDGAVQSSPEAMGTADSVLLFSGAQHVFADHRSVLELLGGARHVGTDPAAAAVHDLALFGLWYDAHVAYLRALDTIRASGIDVEGFVPAAVNQLQHVITAAPDTAREITTRSYPRGPADLTEHASLLDKIVTLRRDQRLGDGDLRLIRQLVAARIDAGLGHEGFNGILD